MDSKSEFAIQGRSLHYVLKIADRAASVKFFKTILGMKTLRHEEFSEGCEATCNGPYKGRWSKTMIGYGPEKDHFVLELTYNYGVKSYEMGNDFLGITIISSSIIERAREADYPIEELHGEYIIEAPGGYKFKIINEPQPKDKDPIVKVTLACSNLQKTIQYWENVLKMKKMYEDSKCVRLGYADNQCLVEFKDIGRAINHAKSFGRIAFAVPKASLLGIQNRIEAEKHKVLTPLLSLDTPGKSSVTVVILADPDDHEICFVDEEGFGQLSKLDENADVLLTKVINKDKS